MMKNTIKLGLVGLSDKMMYSLADSLKKIEKIELAAIVDSDETRGREAATTYGANYVSTVTEAIDDHRLDGICIGSEFEARKGHIHVAIQRETPVLCLNPIAKTHGETKETLNRIVESNIKFYAPLQLRYYERFQQLRNMMIKEGRKLGSLHCTFRRQSNWCGDVMAELGVHVLDLIRWFTRLEIEQIYAETGGKTRDHINVLLLMKLNNGAFASAELSHSLQEDIYVNATYDDMFLQVKPLNQSVFLRSTSTNERYPWNIEPSEYIVEEFVNYLLNDVKPSINLEDVERASLLLSSAIQSNGKEPVRIKL